MKDNFPNIYQKQCPQCMALAAQGAAACRCGHRFDNAETDQAEDEKLYEAYLAARAEQAKQVLAVAQKMYELNPADEAKKASLEEARQEWESIAAELGVQAQRARVAQKAPPAAKPPIASPARQTAPAFVHPVPRLIPRQKPQAPDPGVQHPSVKPALEDGIVKVKGPAGASAQPQKRIGEERVCTRCGRAIEAGKSCACKRNEIAPAVSPEMAQRYPGLYQSYLRSAETGSVAGKTGAPQPAPKTRQASTTPKASAASESAGALRPRAEPPNECPNCQAVLAPHATRCKCGMTFSEHGATAIPALTPPTAASPAKRDSGRTKECPHCTAVVPELATQCKCGLKFPDNGQATVMPGLALTPDEARRLLDLSRK